MADDALVDRVVDSTGLTPGEARRVIDDVVAWYREPVVEYIRRRHRSLHTHGVRNPEAFETIAGELRRRVVGAPELSTRQIRRIIYG